ncbi:hypothetical protein [Eisenibacter elegans]|jgi:hypothetical protein|uniref:hypothetical protein n=1 Tax=Eisenibacter elegans TaxID=997 RepID=UPI00047EA5FD|nr:hypothetical protein [Eisenibacter elegans]
MRRFIILGIIGLLWGLSNPTVVAQSDPVLFWLQEQKLKPPNLQLRIYFSTNMLLDRDGWVTSHKGHKTRSGNNHEFALENYQVNSWNTLSTGEAIFVDTDQGSLFLPYKSILLMQATTENDKQLWIVYLK